MIPHIRAFCKRLGAASLSAFYVTLFLALLMTPLLGAPSIPAEAQVREETVRTTLFAPENERDTLNDPAREEAYADAVVSPQSLRLETADDAYMQADVTYGGRDTTLQVNYRGRAGGDTVADGRFTAIGFGTRDDIGASGDGHWLRLTLRGDMTTLAQDVTLCAVGAGGAQTPVALDAWLAMGNTRPPEAVEAGFSAYYLDLEAALGDRPVYGYKLLFNRTDRRGSFFLGEVALCDDAGDVVRVVESFRLADARVNRPAALHPGEELHPGSLRRTAASLDATPDVVGLNVPDGNAWSMGTPQSALYGAGEERALHWQYDGREGQRSFVTLVAEENVLSGQTALLLRLRGTDAAGTEVTLSLGGDALSLQALTGGGVTGDWREYRVPLSAFAQPTIAGGSGVTRAQSYTRLTLAAAARAGALDIGAIALEAPAPVRYKLVYYKDVVAPANLLADPDASASPPHAAGSALSWDTLAQDFGADFVNRYRPVGYAPGEVTDTLPLTLGADTWVHIVYRKQMGYKVAYYVDSAAGAPLHESAVQWRAAGTSLTQAMIFADLQTADWDSWRPAGYGPGRLLTVLPALLGGEADATALRAALPEGGAQPADGQAYAAEPPPLVIQVLYEREATYPYFIRYHYDGTLSEADTVAATAKAGFAVDSYPEKTREGRYRPDPAHPFAGGAVAAFEEGADNPNVFDVYYIGAEAAPPQTGDLLRIGSYVAVALMALGGIGATLWWVWRVPARS